MPSRPRAEVIGIALLALLAALSLVRRDLFVGDETKYGQVVREMHADGALLLPTLNGEPYTHKPPLHFWLMWAFTGIGGQRTLWPYVLPAMLSALVLIWITGRAASAAAGPRYVWPARFFLTGLAMAWALMQLARMDLMFACFTTAGALSLFRFVDGGRARDAALAGLWFGLGGLVKGPASGLILMSVYLFESVALRRRPRLVDLAILAIAVLVPLVWFVPAVLSAGPAFLEEIVMRQTAGRAVSSWVHREPIWYYLAGAPLIFFPWFFPLIASFRCAREDVASSEVRRWVRWVLAIVVPFSLISSKLPVYMVPAFPPVALLTAWYVGLENDEMKWRRVTLWGHRIGLVLLAIVPVVALSGKVPIRGDGTELLDSGAVRLALVAMAVVATAGLIVGWRSVRNGSLILPFVIALPAAVVLTAAAPALNAFASSGPLVDALSREVRSGDEVGMYYTPHLWSRHLPAKLEEAEQLSLEQLEAGRRPDVLAVRDDKIVALGPVIDDYAEVSSIRFMGKGFHVYRLR